MLFGWVTDADRNLDGGGVTADRIAAASAAGLFRCGADLTAGRCSFAAFPFGVQVTAIAFAPSSSLELWVGSDRGTTGRMAGRRTDGQIAMMALFLLLQVCFT